MRMPLASNEIRANSDNNTFGPMRKYPDGKPKNHQGWDFKAAIGTPCFAVADGTVVSVDDRGDYGKQLLIGIGDNRYAFYAHMDTITVQKGWAVKEGQQIGTTGNSGNAVNLHDDADHLHFEARTTPHPGKGLSGRVSPLAWFGVCPLKTPAIVP